MTIDFGEHGGRPIEPEHGSPLRVLVVEDAPTILMLLNIQLKAIEGVDLVSCETREEGLAEIEKNQATPFGLIVTDLGLKMSVDNAEVDREGGYTVAKSAKAASSATRVVMITGRYNQLLQDGVTHEEVVAQMRSRGIDAVTGKPYTGDWLKEQVRIAREQKNPQQNA